jgi:hypothetical protein
MGGCILFDANGKLIVRQYGFQMVQPNTSSSAATQSSVSVVYSNLCTLLGAMYPAANLTPTSPPPLNPPPIAGEVTNSNNLSAAFVPGCTSSNTANAPFSQLGIVIFDYDAFKAQGFSDVDADINAQSYSSGNMTVGPIVQQQSEQLEETWIDSNSTPVLINRFNGTLIKGE